MAKTDYMELGDEKIPIIYEDRSVLAIDKPAGWMLVPVSWQKTDKNLHAAILSSMASGDFWSRCRNLKFLRHVHRLDADTSGVLLFAKSLGALDTFGDLFESRKMEKIYLAVIAGKPAKSEWTCRLSIGPDPTRFGRMRIDPKGKEAHTDFRVLHSTAHRTLLEARPFTGRTHQLRLHLAAEKMPIIGDELYGKPAEEGLGLRAVALQYVDPFLKKKVFIKAPREAFIQQFLGELPPALRKGSAAKES